MIHMRDMTHVQRALEVLNGAGFPAEWSPTGGGCFAIAVDFGDTESGVREDFSSILITDGGEFGDVYTDSDHDSDENVSDGRYYVGAYDAQADMIGDEGVDVGLSDLVEIVRLAAQLHFGWKP